MVPNFPITMPAATFAILRQFSIGIFAIIHAARVAITVSPAPDTSNTCC